MRAKGPIRVLVVLLAVSLLPALTVSAHHGPTVEDVVAVAEGLGMPCEALATEVDCTGPAAAANREPLTVIKPGTGPLTSVYSKVDAHTNGIHDFLAEDRKWFATIHGVGCADSQAERDAVSGFMDDLAAQFAQSQTGGPYGPLVVGECRMIGRLVTAVTRIAYFDVTSTTLAGAFPTPTPTPTLKPTATPKPTARPTARPTATPAATATATVTVSASEFASASESATATPIPVNTPEQTVLGFTFTPEPSSAAPAPAGGGDDWAGSVPSASQVSTDATKLAGSGLAALLLLLAMGFIGELFNNTFESNYDRILAGWQKSWLGKVGKAFSGLWGGGK